MQANLHGAEKQLEVANTGTCIETFCERVRQGLVEATFDQRRKLIALFIDRVVVTNDQVEIRYVIPTNEASEQTYFCHLRTHYFQRYRETESRGVVRAILETDLQARAVL
jgi:site-specific DNA recombinase